MDIKTLNLPITSKSICCGYDFIISTPSGGDYITCPICDNYTKSYDDNICYDDNIDIPYYCNSCKIFFEFGCKHAENGCTDSTFFAQFIESFEYNGIKYEGMPIIESIKDYVKHYKDFKFNWICTHPSNEAECMCLHASYKDPKYYGRCSKKSGILNVTRKEKEIKKYSDVIYVPFVPYHILRILSMGQGLNYSN
jgi:hypothetical protein